MIQFNGEEVAVYRGNFERGMRLSVNENGKPIVHVGRKSSFTESEISAFVNKHKRFLQNRIRSRENVNIPVLQTGKTIEILGEKYIVVRDDSIKKFEIVGNDLFVPEVWNGRQSARFFGKLYYDYVAKLTEEYSIKYNLRYTGVQVHCVKTTWGLHRADDFIKYNICLVFLPKRYSEYVVVHELCHSVYHDHSKKFWALVEKIMPDYKERRKEMKAYSGNVTTEMLKLLKEQG